MLVPEWAQLLIGAILFTIVTYAILDVVVELIDPRFEWVAAVIMVLLAAVLINNFGLTVDGVNNIAVNPTAIRHGI